jgi:uncharacterized protein (TIGR03435 family)
MTGLKGNYQVAMDFSMEDLMNLARKMGAPVPSTSSSGDAHAEKPGDAASDPGGSNSVFATLQALGLKLESRKSVVDRIVIDHVEKMPTEN